MTAERKDRIVSFIPEPTATVRDRSPRRCFEVSEIQIIRCATVDKIAHFDVIQ